MLDNEIGIKENPYNNFNIYPHYVYATAFLINGELADFKISNKKSTWELRTFRGTEWENEIFINKYWKLTCEYKKILVNNDEEHNKAFDDLKEWLINNFEKHYNLKEFRKIEISEIEQAKDDLMFFNQGDWITREMEHSADILEEYIKQLEKKSNILDKITDKLKEDIKKSKEEIKYWEKEYRETKDNFYKNSYKRQINRWQSRFETLREILNIIGEKK